eukprot:IDg10265t1
MYSPRWALNLDYGLKAGVTSRPTELKEAIEFFQKDSRPRNRFLGRKMT